MEEYNIGLDLKFICPAKATQLYLTLLSNSKYNWESSKLLWPSQRFE